MAKLNHAKNLLSSRIKEWTGKAQEEILPQRKHIAVSKQDEFTKLFNESGIEEKRAIEDPTYIPIVRERWEQALKSKPPFREECSDESTWNHFGTNIRNQFQLMANQ